MAENSNYHKGLLYLVHLIISADGVIDEDELYALETIHQHEGIADGIYDEFMEDVESLSEREIYEKGIDFIGDCPKELQVRAFAWLMRLSESDGEVHPKEVRFMLYSVKKAGVDFDEAINVSKTLPDLTSQ